MTNILAGKRAVVTGSGAAMGEAIASRLIGAGVDVTLIENLGDSREVEGLVTRLSTGAPIDILINGASAIEPAQFEQSMTRSVVTPALLAFRLVPAMVEQGWGRIVTVSDAVAAHPTMIGRNLEFAAKAALEAHTFGVAAEVGGSGVTANAFRARGEDGVISPDEVAWSLLQRLHGQENGMIWNVTDTI